MNHLTLKTLTIIFCLALSAGCLKSNTSNTTGEEGNERILADKIIKQLKNNGIAVFRNVTITGDLDFTKSGTETSETMNVMKTYIPIAVSFDNCIFEGEVIAYRKDTTNIVHLVCFEKSVSMTNCEFFKETTFKSSIFQGLTNFTKSNFAKSVSFENAWFKDRFNYFSETSFSEPLLFQRTTIDGSLDFLKSTFTNSVDFQGAAFRKDIQFGAVKFLAQANFSLVSVQGDCFFNYAEFQDKATFNGSTFNGRTEFMNCVFKTDTEFKRIKFGGLTKFNSSSFSNQLNFSNSFFLLGKPDMADINKAENLEIILDNTKYATFTHDQSTDN